MFSPQSRTNLTCSKNSNFERAGGLGVGIRGRFRNSSPLVSYVKETLKNVKIGKKSMKKQELIKDIKSMIIHCDDMIEILASLDLLLQASLDKTNIARIEGRRKIEQVISMIRELKGGDHDRKSTEF